MRTDGGPRSVRALRLAVTTFAALILPAKAAGQEQGAARIVIGPNIQVSADGDVAHVESHIAINPTDTRHLVGTAITFTNPAVGTETKAYVSSDGGWMWVDAVLPENRASKAWDPVVGFGRTGTPFLVTMQSGENRDALNKVAFFRSGDGGQSWYTPVILGRNYDRNAIMVDHTTGKFRGRVYVTSHHQGGEGVHLFRSSDDGRTFSGPLATGCSSTYYFLVLGDGTLWMPCLPRDTALRRRLGRSAVAISTDGGASVRLMPMRPDPRATYKADTVRFRDRIHVIEPTGPSPHDPYAVDTALFRGRIYVAEVQRQVVATSGDTHQEGTPISIIVVRYSDDRGNTWSAPRRVAPPNNRGTSQHLPALAVNHKGVLGVFWFETPEHRFRYPDFPYRTLDFAFDVYFTASLDGGQSFLPARRVSSQPSRPAHVANHAITLIRPSRSHDARFLFLSAYSRWRDAGDYTGLAAASDGAFHPFWPDARQGAFQLYTARIMVESQAASVRPDGPVRNLDRETEVLFGPAAAPQSDSLYGAIKARIRNTSSDTLWGPFSAHVTMHLPAYHPTSDNPRRVELFDSATGRWGTSTTIDYAAAMGDLPYLVPGATTEAVEWRFRNASLIQLELEVHVLGVGRSR